MTSGRIPINATINKAMSEQLDGGTEPQVVDYQKSQSFGQVQHTLQVHKVNARSGTGI
jgi:hypothetical protein